MDWKKILAIPLAALLLFATACNEAVPSEYSNTEEGTHFAPTPTPTGASRFKKFGDTISYSETEYQNDGSTIRTKLEITVTGAQVFDTFADSGIPVEDTSVGSLNKVLDTDYTLPETPFVLVDVTIKKTEGPAERKSREKGLLMTIFSLHSKQQLEWCDSQDMAPVLLEPSYFSGHGEDEEDGKGYEYFWLEPGEKQEYQVGFFLQNLKDHAGAKDFEPKSYVTSPDEGLMVSINGLYYVDLEIGEE